MKLYKEANVVYCHEEIYEAMRKLSAYRKQSLENDNIHTAISAWVTSYSLGRQTGHTDFIKSVLDSSSKSYAIIGSGGLRIKVKNDWGDRFYSNAIPMGRDLPELSFEDSKYNILVDAGLAFQKNTQDDLYRFLEANKIYIESCVVIGS